MAETLKNKFEYKKLSPEEMKERNIIGRLVGPIADTTKPTRNGRFYGVDVWRHVIDDPIFREKVENRCLFAELGHPTDRIEVDMEKICACMSEIPTISDDGFVYGVWDILPTNNGKILKILCDYGTNIGISSRGEGDVMEDFDGNSHVDPETYTCETFDFVIVPAMKEARMKAVNESLETKSLKKALNEELEKATPENKAKMEETLESLGLLKKELESNPQSLAAKNIGATVVSELQEALLAKQKAESKVLELQEKLSVSYAKETKNEEEVAKYKTTIRNLSESASSVRALQQENSQLKEKLSQQDAFISRLKERYSRLLSEKKIEKESQDKLQEKLNESLVGNNKALENKDNEIKKLNESLTKLKEEKELNEKELNEKLADIRKDLTIKSNEYASKLAKSNQLVEKYINTAKKAVNKYIESKAGLLGVNPESIKKKLPKNYSFDDIDSVCESLNDYNINLSTLPIDVSGNNGFNVQFNIQKESIVSNNSNDDIDEALLQLANLKE